MIKFEGVSYGYGGTPLLRDVSLRLAPGSFQFLTGPSGSGKTTLLRLCYLDLMASTGKITVFDRSATDLNRDDVARFRRRVGMVQQNCTFLDHLPVLENVALPLTVSGQATAMGRDDLIELLNWVGLADRAGAMPPELSGGERQRAALARAVALSPDVILADEPTGNLDWEMSLRLLGLLVELNRLGKAVLIVTHDLTLIRQAKSQVAARVLRISGGQVQHAGAGL